LDKILRNAAQGRAQRSGRFAARVTAVRSVYELFLERCVWIEAVQRHCDEGDAEIALFFRTGCRPRGLARWLNSTGDPEWLDDLPGWSAWVVGDDLPPTWPASARAGWEAMSEACEALVAEILGGEIRLEGTSPSGLRRALMPAELAWPQLALDFRSGELIDYADERCVVRWKDITEAAPEQPVRTTNLIAMNEVRDAEQKAKWAKWQAKANEIGKNHPGWKKAEVARQVKKQLKPAPTETPSTIAKKIKATWRIKKTRHDV
jgi:hypothetical protein